MKSNMLFMSIASFFEISLKVKKGKLRFDFDFEETPLTNDFESIPIALSHLNFLKQYEFPNQDPFDMLIISQALSENLELISYDEAFRGMSMLKLYD